MQIGQRAKSFTKRMVVRKTRSFLIGIFARTAPIWLPIVLAIFLGYFAYMVLFGIPISTMQDQSDEIIKTQAFLGTIGDEELPVDPTLLKDYKTISNTWDAGLTPEQKIQVQAYEFPYTLLMAVDRVVNDDAVWEGKRYVKPKPQKVFDALRPRFYWKNSIVTTVTTSVDQEGKVSTSTTTHTVVLLTKAETYEGTFHHEYEWETTTSGDTTITREVLKDTIMPDTYYNPLRDYLRESRGIKDEETFEIVQQLAIAYLNEDELQIFDTPIDLSKLKHYPPGDSNLPYYNQTDKRWGALSYGKKGTIASSGCGPTSLAMIVAGLTGQPITPDNVAAWSVKNGYRIEGNGSAWALMTDGGKHYGLNVKAISRKDGESIAKALSEGSPVIASMGRGHFTNGGHFIVLRGLTENGKVLVHDPISTVRSGQSWNLELILRESSTNGGVNGNPFWVYSVKEI